MNQYLLLRDNKQSGPYTAQELAAKGIKPYDLVWQEGRSAAWRYPSEIEELKAFAPVVEEQPYDRFYKKPGEQAGETTTATKAQSTTEQQPVAQATNAAQESQPVSNQVEQAVAKHIYVTMPVKGGKEETAKPVAQQASKNTTSTNTSTSNKKAAASSYIISEEDDELNSGMLKGYQSRKQEDDEINNSYMSDYESRKAAWQKQKSGGAATIKQEVAEKPATPKKESWSSLSTTRKKDQFDWKAMLAGSGRYFQDNKNLTRSLVAAVLILGGVVIGLVINSGHRQPDTQVLESLVKEIRDQRNEKTAATAPETENSQQGSEPREEKTYSRQTPNNNAEEPASIQTIPANNTPVQPVTRHAVIKKENSVVTPPQNQNKSIVVPVSNPAPQQPAETSPTVTEPKEKPINQEVLEKARKNIYDQVRVEASAFKVGLLGGISDLDLTIQNTSLYPLDQVSVEVRYFGMEKKLVKTQTIIFNNVPPGKRRTLEVPSTKRGITIDYSITSINSKALGLAQNGF